MGQFLPVSGRPRTIGDPPPDTFWGATARPVPPPRPGHRPATTPEAKRDLRAQLHTRQVRLSAPVRGTQPKIDRDEARLIAKVLASVPEGREAAAVATWRTRLAARRRAGDKVLLDRDGVEWALDRRLFDAFDRLERFIDGGHLVDDRPAIEHDVPIHPGKPLPPCTFCHNPWPLGSGYCYGCGRDRDGYKSSPTMGRPHWGAE